MANSIAIGVAYKDQEIVGGTIDNTVIGGVTKAAGSFTTVTSTGGFVMPSATVAAAGSTQANATQIATGFTLVSGADATKGILLPLASAGATCVIKNNAAAVLKVWPSSGDAVNAIAADSNYVLASLTSTLLVAYDNVTWYSVPLLAS